MTWPAGPEKMRLFERLQSNWTRHGTDRFLEAAQVQGPCCWLPDHRPQTAKP